jgi:cell division protein FtsN
VLLLFALSSGIDRWKRYRAEKATEQTAAPAQPSKAIGARPPKSMPESSAPAEPAPPMVVKPNPPNRGKMASTERRSEPTLPRSKTTIITSEAPAGDDESAAESAPSTGTAPSQCVPTPHRYNIEVNSVSEKSEADAMVGRIADLGFKACEKTSTVNGETRYAVRIGPYNTEDEAAAAQEKLHEQYKAAYSDP